MARQPAPRDGGRPRGARDDHRPERRAARDREAGDHGVREPAPGRPPARPHAGRVAGSLGVDPGATYAALTDRSRGFVYVARKADSARAEKLEKLGFAGLGFYPEELRTYPQGSGRARRCSGSRASTTRASRGSSARSRRCSPGGPGAGRSSRTRSAARSTSSRRSAETPGQERPADDRPPDPGERRGGPARDRRAGTAPGPRPRSS